MNWKCCVFTYLYYTRFEESLCFLISLPTFMQLCFKFMDVLISDYFCVQTVLSMNDSVREIRLLYVFSASCFFLLCSCPIILPPSASHAPASLLVCSCPLGLPVSLTSSLPSLHEGIGRIFLHNFFKRKFLNRESDYLF